MVFRVRQETGGLMRFVALGIAALYLVFHAGLSADEVSDAVEAPASAVEAAELPPDESATDSGIRRAVPEISLKAATETAKSYGFRAFLAVILLAVTDQLIKVTVFVVERLAERSPARRLLYKRLVPIIRLFFWLVAVLLIVRVVFEVDTRGLVAAAAAIGVAVGFAAQDILKNIFGGFVIIADKPFQVGDKISVGGTYGEVVSIGLRSTRIVTADDNSVSVPNAQVVDSQVSNANSGALHCQVVTDLYLPGWADENSAKQIAFETAATSQYVYLKQPIVVIVKDEYREGHVLHLLVKAYVLDNRYELLLVSDITERARSAFREAGLLATPRLLPKTRAVSDTSQVDS